MIEHKLDKEQLAHRISEWGQDLVTGRQIYLRLHKLLPARYKEIVSQIRRVSRSSKATRLALLDDKYLAHIDELCDLGHTLLHTKIQRDTHLMLFKCKSQKL